MKDLWNYSLPIFICSQKKVLSIYHLTMNVFLESIAKHFIQHYAQNLHSYCFVFPNRRSGKFFAHYLQQSASAPFIMPQITTLTDLVAQTYHYNTVDPVILVLELYKVYYHMVQESRGVPFDFDSFYAVGEMILNDFGDVDRQLIDAKELFGNVFDFESIRTDLREVLSREQWDQLKRYFTLLDHIEDAPNDRDSYHQKFSYLWSQLYNLYTEYKQTLKAKGLCYDGMALRQLAEDTPKLELITKRSRLVLVGFYTITKAERKIFEAFQRGGALFYRDIPATYLPEMVDAEELDASFPMPTGGDAIDFGKEQHHPVFETYVFSSTVAQTTFLGHKLREVSNTDIQQLKAAVVLPTERLLVPLRAALPTDIEQVNVTMGYPVKDTQLAGMLELLLQALQTQELVGKLKGDRLWSARDVQAIISQSVFTPILSGGGLASGAESLSRSIYKKLRQERLYNVSAAQLKLFLTELLPASEASDLFHHIFGLTDKPTGMEVLKYVREILQILYKCFPLSQENTNDEKEEQGDPLINLTLHQAVIPHLMRGIDEVISSVQTTENTQNLTSSMAYNILRTLIRNSRIPFTGEPLKGLQVMGILEARCLDFKTLYIPDASEGLLPQKRRVMGIIPYVLRLAFDMPTYKWQDRIRAYNFFRLIAKAEKVVFTYDATKNSYSTGEISRYLSILKYIYGRNLNTQGVAYPLMPIGKVQSVEIDPERLKAYRDALVLDKEKGRRYLSPSAIKDYIQCPRQFYYKKILGIEQEEEPEDLVQANVLGDIVHNTLGKLLDRYKGKPIDKAEIKQWLLPQDPTINRILTEQFTEQKIRIKGYNEVQYGVAKHMVQETLRKECARKEQLIYIGEEIPCTVRYPLAGMHVNLGGRLDRVDVLPGEYIRVVDYKTGRDVRTFSLEDFDVKKPLFNGAAFQILAYCLMLEYCNDNCWKQQYGTCNLLPALSKTVEGVGDDFLKWKKDRKQEDLLSFASLRDDFKAKFESILLRIVRDDQEFRPVVDKDTKTEEKACLYCPAKGICIKDKKDWEDNTQIPSL